MKKNLLMLFFCLFSGIVCAGGFDLEFFGYKVFNFGFDVNPFSRDDGRSSGIHVISHAPQYYTPPPVRSTVTRTAKPEAPGKKKTSSIEKSSNVTVNCYETQQTARPVYASNTYVSYPVSYTYTYPVSYSYAYPVSYSYAYPVSYVYPRCYYPYSCGYYRPRCYSPYWYRYPYYW